MPRICLNLTFDDPTEHAVRRVWQGLADAGLIVRGLTGYRPHVTLAVYKDTDPAGDETPLAELAAATCAFSIHLDVLGIFPETGVLFLAPRMSHALFTLHRQALQAMAAAGKPTVVDEGLLPDRWVPHCTLAGHLIEGELSIAIACFQRSWAPIHGTAAGIGLRRYPEPADHRYDPFGQHRDA